MLIIYNIVQLLALLLLVPFLALWVLMAAKYRSRIPLRLGFGLRRLVRGLPSGPRVWIHALSVGEMASARPLVQLLRREMPEVVIILSFTTRGGEEYGKRLAGVVDCLVPFPLDCYWVVAHFVRVLRPDLFVLVETDFWPNLLARLQREGVPSLLVNGRITNSSMASYQRFKFLFAPLFQGFWRISMQMGDDARRLAELGVTPERIVVCGNLKYDMTPVSADGSPTLDLSDCGLSGRPLLVAGSTHAGEEDILLDTFLKLRISYPELAMVIAPRTVTRAPAVLSLGDKMGLKCGLRSNQGANSCQVLVLDTLGELAQVYQQADLAFVGGSLVNEGGHNPLEPALFGKPVLFGTDMSDFAEISRDLCEAGAAVTVTAESILEAMTTLLAQEERRKEMGRAAEALVLAHQGASACYLRLIREGLGYDQ
jgi:3-deoxy-D-manno-octulosonic-acid transferase